MDAELLAIELLVAAFAGGAFGAAIGALPSFVFTGVLVIVGETLRILRRAISPVASVPQITDLIAFGVVFGPHVSFAGGAAAAAYAARKGYLNTSSLYHPAKEITVGLGSRVDVLIVGGLFGVAGHLIVVGSVVLSAPWDPVAMGVVLSALLHRLAFGYDLIGEIRSNSLFDMSPFEREVATDGDRLLVEPWLPHMCRWNGLALLGALVGILGGYLAYVTASPFLGFGISAVSLVFLVAGVDGIPVTHHMTLPASTGVLALAGLSVGQLSPEAVASAVPLWQALLIGAIFGLIGALAGEFIQRILYAHADTHLDPPAGSIVVTTALIATLTMIGIFETAVWIPHP